MDIILLLSTYSVVSLVDLVSTVNIVHAHRGEAELRNQLSSRVSVFRTWNRHMQGNGQEHCVDSQPLSNSDNQNVKPCQCNRSENPKPRGTLGTSSLAFHMSNIALLLYLQLVILQKESLNERRKSLIEIKLLRIAIHQSYLQ